MLKLLLIFSFSLVMLGGCSSSPIYRDASGQSTTKRNDSAKSAETNEVPYSKKVYFFQHRVLTDWTYNSEGQFFDDLILEKISSLKIAASKYVSMEFADQIEVKAYESHDAALIIFPKPQSPANCYFVLITQSDNKFDYYTYERMFSFSGDSSNETIFGVVGHWSKEGSHGNLGARSYQSARDFVEDVLNLRKQ